MEEENPVVVAQPRRKLIAGQIKKLDPFELINQYGKYIFIIYLAIVGNYIGELIGCQIQGILSDYVMMKHLIGFLTLYFFITLPDDTVYGYGNTIYKLIFAIFAYITFMLSTRMNSTMWVIFILMISSSYILSIVEENLEDEPGEKVEKTQTALKYTRFGLIGASLIILIIGVIYYMGEKKIEYGKHFNYFDFFFGKPSCLGSSPENPFSTMQTFWIGLKPGSLNPNTLSPVDQAAYADIVKNQISKRELNAAKKLIDEQLMKEALKRIRSK